MWPLLSEDDGDVFSCCLSFTDYFMVPFTVGRITACGARRGAESKTSSSELLGKEMQWTHHVLASLCAQETELRTLNSEENP